MRTYCVKFYNEGDGILEICYPAKDAWNAIELCKKDYPDAKYYIAKEVM